MYGPIKNSKGEPLYLLVMTESNSFNDPFIKICNWHSAEDTFINMTAEKDDENWFIKRLKIERKENWLEATLLCNHKGWGRDFFRYIYVKPIKDIS